MAALLEVIDARVAPVDPVPVPRAWPGETVVCLGGGPSLTVEDVAAVRGRTRVIAINDAYRLAPWADALIASDAKWWRHHDGVPSYAGPKYCLQVEGGKFPGVSVLRNTGRVGIETDPAGLRSGSNTGAAAINLAVHYGAARVLLLGYDMGPDGSKRHWFGDHPKAIRAESPYHVFRDMFATQVQPLRELGVEVLNCSRRTALEAFPRVTLEEALG